MAYWWTQPANSKTLRKSDKNQAALPLKDRQTEKSYGPGQNVWVKKFDPDTAKIVSRFKADDYQPRNDGWVVVKQPRAQFFMKDGRAISVEGESGEIIMDDNNKTGMKALAGSRDTPSRGRLYNVTIHMFHAIDRPEEQLDDSYRDADGKPLRPGMTITLNNASFDNQTFKIYSEGFGKGKKHVEADQVPVTLRGDDYDFDGKGLVIRWNERDRRLQLLEIAHGEKLTTWHPNSVMKKEGPTTAPAVVLEGPLPVMLAAKGRAATGEALTTAPAPAARTAPAPAPGPSTRRSRPAVPKPKITPNTDPPLYRAIFHENVRIVQGADLNVTASKMSVDFLMQDQGDAPSAEATTKPAGRVQRPGAATQPISGGVTQDGAPTTEPATQLAHRAARRPTTAPPTTASRRGRGATTAPSTSQPADGEIPVIITWTGKLVVEPLSVGPENPIKNGDAVVRLDGAPVVATQQDSTIYSGTLTYRTEDQAMLLTPMAAAKPIIMTDTKRSLVHTTRMDFFQPKHQAILYGASDALFPQQDDTGKPGAPLLAKWSKTCILYFANAPKDEAASRDIASSSSSMNIERAELDGDVFVDHPQLKLNSQALDLTFDTSKDHTTKPTTRPQMSQKQVAAEKPVSAVQAALKDHDEQIAQALAPFSGADLDGLLQAKSHQLELLEDRIALQSKAMKDMNDSGQAPPKGLRDGFQAAQAKYSEVKADFESTQKTLVHVQDLRSERAELSRQAMLAQRQLLADAAVRGAASQPTSQPTTRPAMRSDLK